MTSIGYATLDVIPSLRGVKGELERGMAGPAQQVGTSVGTKLGDTVGKTAGTRIKGHFTSALSSLKTLAPLGAAGLGLGIVKLFSSSIAEAREAATVARQTEAVLRATGNAANVTSGQIADLAATLSKKVGVDDEAIQSGENLLLTFRNIKNEAGKGNDIFNQATGAILDLSTAMDQDLKSSAVQVGKALNDPIKGMTALQRVGVTFTEQQKAQAKALVATGDTIGAQKIILAELNKEFGGAAVAGHDAFDRLGVAVKNFQEELGTKALPAASAFAGAMEHGVLPALSGTLSVTNTIAGAFNDLPGPVKAATGALVALKLAAAAGIPAATSRTTSALVSGMTSLRLRTMLAADAFAVTRAESGRMVSAMGALRAGAAGAGSAISRGLGGALSLVGGPWGAAFIAGTAIVAKFWQQHQQAKARVDELTASLDQQSGAVTANTREIAARQLQESGMLDSAAKLGLNLRTVTDAYTGNAKALKDLNAARDASIRSAAAALAAGDQDTHQKQQQAFAIRDLVGELTNQNGAMLKAQAAQKQVTEATSDATQKNSGYAHSLADARDKLLGLIDAENKRHNMLLKSRQDQVALNQAILDARKEAREGKRTLEGNTQAANANNRALNDLASQWNSSSKSVQNAKGAYADTRTEFVKLAHQMGATWPEARKLGRELLDIPKKVSTDVSTPGLNEAIANIQRLQSAVATANRNRILIRTSGANTPQLRAEGGPVWRGSSYIVGERGPELFTPSSSGAITPNHAMTVAGAGGPVMAVFSDEQVRILSRALAAGAASGIGAQNSAFAAERI